MVHSRIGQIVVFLAAGVVAGLISLGLDRVWKRSRWRDVAVTVACLYIVLFWVLP
jgi:hypothetical protein